MIKGKIVYVPRVVDDESEEEVDDFDWSDPFLATTKSNINRHHLMTSTQGAMKFVTKDESTQL